MIYGHSWPDGGHWVLSGDRHAAPSRHAASHVDLGTIAAGSNAQRSVTASAESPRSERVAHFTGWSLVGAGN